MLFDRSFDLPHPLAGHTISVDDFNQRYVSPVLAHSRMNIVLFIQDKVCFCGHESCVHFSAVILQCINISNLLRVT